MKLIGWILLLGMILLCACATTAGVTPTLSAYPTATPLPALPLAVTLPAYPPVSTFPAYPPATLPPTPIRKPSATHLPTTAPLVRPTRAPLTTGTLRPVPRPELDVLLSATPYVSPTVQPTATAAPFPQGRIKTELPVLDPSGAVGLHDLILFSSHVLLPFPIPLGDNENIDMSLSGLTRFYQYGLVDLWAISPDGLRGGRVSPDG
jgi:hypothetical protein